MSTHKRIRPPRYSARLLAWLLDDDWETPAGDFEEYFNQMVAANGEQWARRWYRRQVLAMLPGRLIEKSLWSMFMLFGSLKVAFRTMRKRPFMAVVNVGGLSVGIAACLLIFLYVHDELTFDSMHTRSDRIARIVDIQTTDAGDVQHQVYTMNALGPSMADNLADVESSVRLLSRWTLGRQTARHGDTWFYEGRYLTVDSTFFDFFDFRFLSGSPESALNGPARVVLTESTAQLYFGDEDPLGKTLTLQRQGELTVSAVIEDPPPNTHLDFSMLVSMSTMHVFPGFTDRLEEWDTQSSITYVLLRDGASLETVQVGVDALVDRMSEDRRVWLQPMTDIHFGSSHVDFDWNANAASRTTVLMLLLVGVFILLIAGINYTNLTMAASLGRAREVGLRLTSGAWRSQLARQFMGESLASTLVAATMALGAALLILSSFNNLTGKLLEPTPVLVSLLLAIIVVLGTMSGAWPAWVMSRLSPAAVLKGGAFSVKGGSLVREGLVITQFTLSIGLIVASLIVHGQMQHIQTADLGFDREHLVVVDINAGGPRANFRSMKADFAQIPAVESVSVSSNIPGDWKNISQIDVGQSADDLVTSSFLGIDSDFLDTFGIDLLEGRNLDDRTAADSLSVLITRTTASLLSVRIGDRLTIPGTSLFGSLAENTFQPTVVGIVDDFNFQSLHEPIGPMVLGFHSSPIDVIDYFTVRIDGQDVPNTIAALRAVGERYDAETPFEYNFLDDRMQDFYIREARLGWMVGIATGLAIFLACLGLFALSAHMTTQRTREIGVRKVLGASSGRIVFLLSKDVLKPVGIAFLVSTPVSWLIMTRWLDSFAYRVELGPATWIAAGGLAIIFAFATVSWHAVRAAGQNPVESLKHE